MICGMEYFTISVPLDYGKSVFKLQFCHSDKTAKDELEIQVTFVRGKLEKLHLSKWYIRCVCRGAGAYPTGQCGSGTATLMPGREQELWHGREQAWEGIYRSCKAAFPVLRFIIIFFFLWETASLTVYPILRRKEF